MHLRKGNMWSHGNCIKFVTTNNVVREGKLIMGAGAAKQLRDAITDIDYIFGELIRLHDTPHRYGVIYQPHYRIGIFQTKYHYNNPAQLELIEYSTQMLKIFAECVPYEIVLNFPGIGHGQLPRKYVLPIISILPNNVFIYEKDTI